MSTVVTARIDERTSEALDALCARLDRSRAWVMARAVSTYVDEQTELLEFLQKGIDDLDTGRWISHEHLTEQINQRRSERRAA